jgi:hypothetical protein
MPEIENNAVTTTEDIQPIVPKDFIKKVETAPRTGLYLIEPHAHWISTGFKTGFVKSKKYDIKPKDPVYLLGHGLCYGTMLIGEPQEISIEEFGKLENKHRINEKTREKWCKDYKAWCKGPLFFYPVKMVERFKPPTVVTLPKGTQNWIDAKNIKFEKLKELPMSVVIRLHAHCHFVQDLDLHDLVNKEFLDRKMSHPYLDSLDRIQDFLIQDWKTYNAKDLMKTPHGRKIILDDHRIVHAWWHLLQTGKRMMSPQFKDYSLTEQKKIVKGLHDQIADAFKSMGWNYTPLKETDSLSTTEGEATFEELFETLSISKIEEEALVDVSKIEFKDLEGIDDVYCKKLDDKDLVTLDKRLHAIYREQSKITEPLSNAHIFVWSEMVHRNIRHEIDDPLTEATALDVVEYPTPRGFASKDKPDENIPANFQDLPVLRILSAFPEQIILMDPPAHIHVCGSTVNKELSQPGHDIDVLVKQSFPDKRLMNALTVAIRERDPEVAKRIHWVFDPHGPQVGYSMPIYRLAYVRVPPNEWGKHSPWEYLSDIALGKPIRSLKSGTGFDKFEFFDPVPLWNNWAASRIEKGIVMQKKFDGMRIQIHRKGDKVWFFTEDRQRDRADVFKKSAEELVKHFKADNFIIDTEMVWYNCEGKDTKDKEDFCQPRPREEMIPWITSTKMKLDDEDIVFHVHDCMIYDGQDMTQKGYTERLAAVDKIIPSGTYHFKAVPGYEVHDKREFDRTLAKVRRIRGSEGAMLKQADSIYKLTGRTTDWAKIKNVKEIDVMVWEVIPKKEFKTGQVIPGQYMYDCVISVPCGMKDKIRENGFKEWKGKCYYLIGRSYASAVKCSKGDILAVRPIRIAQFEEKGRIYWTWMFPTVKARNPNKTEPDGLDVVKKLIAAGTAPLSTLAEEVVQLPPCPFYEDLKVCPLKPRFARTMDDLSKKMYLRFPVACSLAYYWKCRYVKPYYYDYLVEPETEAEIKEDEECPCKKLMEM